MSAADATAAAQLPPPGLPGLDPDWSHLVDVVDAAGITRTFHVLDTGPAVDHVGTVLCVHGNPTWSYLWRALLADPPPGWRVVAVDQLGMGYSERIGTTRRLAERISDLGTLSEALHIDGPVVTVAHDWGGPVSLGWALAHRAQLAGVVLTNTAVHQPEGARAPTLIRLAGAPGMLATVCRNTPTFVRGTTALSRPRPPRQVRDAFAAPYATPARRQAVADFVADIPLSDSDPSMPTLRAVADGVKGLDVPVLLAWGPADPVFSDLYLRDLLERLPHADVHRYEGASHLVTEDAPATLPDIRRWISGLADRSPAPPASAAARDSRRSMDSGIREAAADLSRRSEPAIVELTGVGRTVSWEQLDSTVTALAGGLWEAGVRPGERVALLVPPGADLAAALFACWRIGAVIVVADAGLGLRGLARALRGAWPDHVIAVERGLLAARLMGVGGRKFAAGPVNPRRARALGAQDTLAGLARRGRGAVLPAGPATDDVAAVVFTSGATGPAKGVVYRHGQIEANRDALVTLYGITEADRLVAAFAPFALYGPAMGITSVVPHMDVTQPGSLTATGLADAVAAVSATLVWASPATLRNVVASAPGLSADDRRALAGVRLLMSAGAPVPSELLHSVVALMPGAEAHTPYGMTEVLPVADADLAQIDKAGAGEGVCVGTPVTDVLVAISALDADGHATGELDDAPGITGEIVVSAGWAKTSYDRLWATESASRIDGPDWHRTGDVGHLDADGRLWVEGRLTHVVTTDSGPVTPVGVELRVEALPVVRAAGCVGVGPAGSQVVVVVVVPDSPVRRLSLADQQTAAAVRGAAGVEVAAVLAIDELPVDIRHNSKIDRAALGRLAARFLS